MKKILSLYIFNSEYLFYFNVMLWLLLSREYFAKIDTVIDMSFTAANKTLVHFMQTGVI